MIYVDPFYLAVIRHVGDGRWHSLESIETAFRQKGYDLRQTCRVGAILEAEVDDPDAKTEKEAAASRRAEYKAEKINGRMTDFYRINKRGQARIKELAVIKSQKGLFSD